MKQNNPKLFEVCCAELGFETGAGRIPEVEQVNPSAPLQYRLLCKMTSPWPEAFGACTSEQFQPISEADLAREDERPYRARISMRFAA